MGRALPYLLGPELFWAATCVTARLWTRVHLPPDPAMTARLDQYWAVLPLIFVPLTFAFFFCPGIPRWWLLLRVDLALAIGLAVATTQYCKAITYHQPSAGPGAGTAFMVMLGLGYMLMVLGTIVAALVIGWRRRATG